MEIQEDSEKNIYAIFHCHICGDIIVVVFWTKPCNNLQRNYHFWRNRTRLLFPMDIFANKHRHTSIFLDIQALKRGGYSVIVCILISVLLESISICLHIPEEFYRLLAFRYVFLIYIGYVWAKQGISINVKTLMFSGFSIIFIVLLDYTNISLPFLYPAWANHHWICYFYCAYLLVFLLYLSYHRIGGGLRGIVCQIGKSSYWTFLVQMFIFTLLRLIFPMILEYRQTS